MLTYNVEIGDWLHAYVGIGKNDEILDFSLSNLIGQNLGKRDNGKLRINFIPINSILHKTRYLVICDVISICKLFLN